MPIRDRKFYIKKHNGEVEEEKASMKNKNGVTKTNNPDLLNNLALNDQMKERNLRARSNENNF